jgi:ABC-2 type transport system ATP-binding protein
MIEAKGLARRFGAFTAVEGMTLTVPDGTILALLGPNGAGKTTTVRMLAGLLAPTSGEAFVAGHDVRRHPAAVRAAIGLVTDQPGLHEQMSVPAYLDFFGSLYGMPRHLRERRIADLVAFFDLTGHQRERMAGFSKGMKQKVALARALLHEPAALFLDEPTSGLDPLAARAVRDLVVALKHSSRSIILCTHDLDEAERLADTVVILRHGQIVAGDAPVALRTRGAAAITVHMELAEPCPAALDALWSVPGVEGPLWETSGQVDKSAILAYSTADPAMTNPGAVAQVVAAGGKVVSVTCTMRSLEDVYAEIMHEGASKDGMLQAAAAAGSGQRRP